MQLGAVNDPESLSDVGLQAARLLCSGDVSTLADRYGYALAHGREAGAAIEEELRRCLKELGTASLMDTVPDQTVAVRYFEPNDTGLFAIIECFVLAQNGGKVMLDLIVTNKDADKYVTLEEIRAAA